MNHMENNKMMLPGWMAEERSSQITEKCTAKMGFLRSTMKNISTVFENDLYCEKYAAKSGLLQLIDPRVKICLFLVYMIFSGFVSNPALLTVLAAIPIIYAGVSGVRLKDFIRRVWLTVPLIVLLFSLLGTSSLFTGGKPLFYLLPAGMFGLKNGVFFSAGGIVAAFRIALRTGISISFATLLLLTTRWSRVTSAFAAMHLPQMVVSVFDMTYRYIFFLSESAEEMIEARFLRTTGKVRTSDSRRLMGHSIAILFLKSHAIGDEVYDAMRCRGYDGRYSCLFRPRIHISDIIFVLINFIILIFLSLVR